MKEKLLIKQVIIDEFEYERQDLGYDYNYGCDYLVWRPGNVLKTKGCLLRILTDGGLVGEYMTGSPLQTRPTGEKIFFDYLIGKNALAREYLWSNIHRGLRHYASLGLAAVDIALWDLAGKYFGAPIHELIGYYRKSLPCYATTFYADNLKGGLDSPEAYADLAEQCLKMGFRGFKLHGWGYDTYERLKQEVATMHALRDRVGDKMELMSDPACTYPTFVNALEIGRACDDEKYLWLEDPFKDGGVSAFAHRKLRQLIKTPLLLGEHLHTVYPKVDFILADGTDFIRGDISNDGGITGVMKLAHAAEGLGLDVEMHGGDVATQHCMAAMRNTNFLEVLGPQPGLGGGTKVDNNGCVNVPEKPGLGVQIDWDFIEKHRTDQKIYE